MTIPQFIDGMMFKRPPQGAPTWIKGKVSINVAKFIEALKEQRALGNISEKGWLNLELKESKTKSLYFEVNTWKPPTPESTQKVENTKQEIRSFLSSEEKKILDDNRNLHNAAIAKRYEPNDGADFETDDEINPEDVPF